MEEWKWLINQGIALVALVFVGALLWRVLVGTEKTGYQGMLVKWAQGVSGRISEHAKEMTTAKRQEEKQHAMQITALQLLVESQDPPVGAAFLSAKAVHKTAAEVQQLRKIMREFMEATRLVATQFPDVQQGINGHCDEIERMTGEA